MSDLVLESVAAYADVVDVPVRRRSWEEVDHALRELARSRSALDADEARLLAIAVRDQIWRRLGKASLLEYLEDVLGYSPRQATERVRVAKELAELPMLEDALATNALQWSAVRELTRVATPTTEVHWLDAARGKNLRQIEALVAGHDKGDEPDDPPDPNLALRKLALRVRPETLAQLRVARERIEGERGEPVDDDVLIATLLRSYLEGGSADGERGLARFQIMTVLCPSCDCASHEAAGRRYPIDAASRKVALCDAQWIGSDRAPERATQDVAPKTRRFVHRRDAGKCTVPDCRASRFIDVHHIVPRYEGGSHDATNLTLLCDGHHRALHDGKLTITGMAPQLAVRWNVLPSPPRDRNERDVPVAPTVSTLSAVAPNEPNTPVAPTVSTSSVPPSKEHYVPVAPTVRTSSSVPPSNECDVPAAPTVSTLSAVPPSNDCNVPATPMVAPRMSTLSAVAPRNERDVPRMSMLSAVAPRNERDVSVAPTAAVRPRTEREARTPTVCISELDRRSVSPDAHRKLLGRAADTTTGRDVSRDVHLVEDHVQRVRDAKQAIVQLGFTKPLANTAVEETWHRHGPDLPLARLIYLALRSLSTSQPS